jgi:hypothetical protein
MSIVDLSLAGKMVVYLAMLLYRSDFSNFLRILISPKEKPFSKNIICFSIQKKYHSMFTAEKDVIL